MRMQEMQRQERERERERFRSMDPHAFQSINDFLKMRVGCWLCLRQDICRTYTYTHWKRAACSTYVMFAACT